MTGKEEFFDRYWASLENEGWQAIILHSWKNLPAQIESDIDYAVMGCAPDELISFLADFARKEGWLLVQVIEHEPSALFCVCVQNGAGFDRIALDVTWDYRRLGHQLLDSKILFSGAREVEGKSFKVPSPGTEAAYVLAKAAAKKKDFREVANRLGELLNEAPDDFLNQLGKSFGFKPELSGSPACILEELEKWYPEARAFRPVRGRKRYGFSEILMYLRRCVRPTGLWLGFQEIPSKNWLSEVLNPIVPLFRRYERVSGLPFTGFQRALRLKIRTSLVVEEAAEIAFPMALFRRTIKVKHGQKAEEVSREILNYLENRVIARIGRKS